MFRTYIWMVLRSKLVWSSCYLGVSTLVALTFCESKEWEHFWNFLTRTAPVRDCYICHSQQLQKNYVWQEKLWFHERYIGLLFAMCQASKWWSESTHSSLIYLATDRFLLVVIVLISAPLEVSIGISNISTLIVHNIYEFLNALSTPLLVVVKCSLLAA